LEETLMTSLFSKDGQLLAPNEGEAVWFNGALVLIKSTSEQTSGRLSAVEFVCPKGFASPLHVHRNDDELFYVLSGEVRFQLGEKVVEGTAGSFVYGPQGVGHSFRIDSPEARLLLVFGPGAGTEGLFREGGKPARTVAIPPADETFTDIPTLMAIAQRHGQDFVGPPLPPKD
jgi:quercetin dioxygenase-like cupin family protein